MDKALLEKKAFKFNLTSYQYDHAYLYIYCGLTENYSTLNAIFFFPLTL